MACWADDVEAYALNEVAINWNAPLTALAIFLDHTERRATRAGQATSSKE
jgi:endoglucanase